MPSWDLMTQVGRIMRRAANCLPHESDWPLLALQVLSVPEVARGLKASTIVDQLKARHVQRTWGGVVTSLTEPSYQRDDRIVVCAACHVAWPCDDMTIIIQGERHDGTEGSHGTEETAAART